VRGTGLIAIVALAGGCAGPFELEVDVGRRSAPAGVEVRIDGQAIPDAPYYVGYDTFADAEAAPALAIEVRRDGTVVDSFDLRPDFCLRECRNGLGDGCGLGDLVTARETLSIEPDGSLRWGGSECSDGDHAIVIVP